MKNKYTIHHIIPKSRGGDNSNYNTIRVLRKYHEKYHTLFDNRTPEEIVNYLNDTFWGRKYFIKISRLEEL